MKHTSGRMATSTNKTAAFGVKLIRKCHKVTVNGDRYRAMITNFFIPELNNHDVQELWFQQDVATCPTARATIDVFKDTFVLYQNFDAHVYDEFVIRGNIGVLHCNLPSHVRDYVKVTSWKRDDGLVILQQRNNDNDRYVVYPSGELHIRIVDYSDSHFMYKCQVRNSLTRQSKESSTGGRLIVTVNGDRYRAMITNVFIPELNNHDVLELCFQQDGATCHTACATIDLLKDTSGDRLISRFGPVNWPPRSCDLTPLDYFSGAM
ncbi:down syndrome cell adhesion molecule [Trichonephila clavipes]|nr:down syndrome cell adhesion molecule [Trichonephila clavipes]